MEAGIEETREEAGWEEVCGMLDTLTPDCRRGGEGREHKHGSCRWKGRTI